MHLNKPGKIFAVVQKEGDKNVCKPQQFLCICNQIVFDWQCVYFLQAHSSTAVEVPHRYSIMLVCFFS